LANCTFPTLNQNTTGNAATATNISWSGVTGGTRSNYALVIQPPSGDYAGFDFRTSAGGGGGYFLIRGDGDADVYTANGITLVADAGWLTLAQRSTASKGVKIMTGVTSLERFKITTAGDVQIVNGNSFTYNSNVVLHAGNYTSYPDATKLPLTGGTLTGGLSGTTSYFSSDVTWTGYNSGNPRAARLGYSGGNYGSVSYGINYTATTASHTYAFNDAVTRIELADGIQVYSAAAAVAGTAVSWTTLLEATRGNGNLRWKGNTVLDSNNYNSFALPLGGGTMTGNIILPAAGYVGLAGSTTYGIGVLATNRGSGVFDTLESTGSDPLELNYYQGGPVKIGNGTNGSKALYAVGIYDNGNAVLTSASTSAPSLSIGGNATTATNGFSVKPDWAFAANLISDLSNFNNSVPSGFYQYASATNSPGTSWYNLINVRHSNTGNDHGFQLAMSYYADVLWSRSYQGGTGANNGTFTTWRAHLHSGNFNSYALPLAGTPRLW
jgi:hypothetical protein